MKLGKLFSFRKPRRAGIHVELARSGLLPNGMRFSVHGPGGHKIKGLSVTVKMPGSR